MQAPTSFLNGFGLGVGGPGSALLPPLGVLAFGFGERFGGPGGVLLPPLWQVGWEKGLGEVVWFWLFFMVGVLV